MDTVAVALEIAAMAMLVSPQDLAPGRAVANGLIAGAFAGSALLTTPRVILWAAGLAGAAAVATWQGRTARGTLIAIASCGFCAAACVTIWTMVIGAGPVPYALNLFTGAQHDAFNSLAFGPGRCMLSRSHHSPVRWPSYPALPSRERRRQTARPARSRFYGDGP